MVGANPLISNERVVAYLGIYKEFGSLRVLFFSRCARYYAPRKFAFYLIVNPHGFHQ